MALSTPAQSGGLPLQSCIFSYLCQDTRSHGVLPKVTYYTREVCCTNVSHVGPAATRFVPHRQLRLVKAVAVEITTNDFCQEPMLACT